MKKILLYISLICVGALLGMLVLKMTANKSDHAAHSFSIEADHDHSQHSAEVVYTCSMHPSVEQNEPGDCPICGMALVPKTSVDNEGMDPNYFHLSDRALALADVQTAFIETSKDHDGIINYTGKIASTEASSKTQSAYVSGRIEKLYVHTTGETVRQGQLLASIYSPDLLSAQQELLAAHKRKDQSPGLYQAVYNKLKQWKLSETQIQRLIETGKPTANFPISAMVSGEVISKNVNEGSYVEAGQSLFEIVDLSKVWGVIDLPESQINLIQIGDRVSLSTSTAKDIVGKVTDILPMLDQATRTAQVRVEIPNPERKLKPGQLLRAAIETEVRGKESLLIPKSSVLWTGKRSVVYIAHRDEANLVFEMREVELGMAQGDYYEIISGLKANEEIVTQGAFTVDAAAQLQGRPSMMSQDESKIIRISAEDQEKLIEFMTYYFQLKDAFIGSNPKDITHIAQKHLDAIDNMHLHIENRALTLWNRVMVYWHELAHSEGDVKKQRDSFKSMNEELIPLAQALKNRHDEWFLQECPMADSNTGGYWISLDQKVVNPYFGEQMLHCGSVEEKWQPSEPQHVH